MEFRVVFHPEFRGIPRNLLKEFRGIPRKQKLIPKKFRLPHNSINPLPSAPYCSDMAANWIL
jgi:hypothetical protein